MAQKILIVEDEEKIARFVELELLHEGYEAEKVFDGRTGLDKALSGGFDLVVLVSGLDAGADDYLTKPFAIEELLARIRVALKRRGVAEVHTHRIEIRGVCMDTDRHEVIVCGEIVELTNREFELLRTLMENKDIVMDREKLLNAVCGYDYLGETNIIDDRFGVKLITTVRGVGYVIRE